MGTTFSHYDLKGRTTLASLCHFLSLYVTSLRIFVSIPVSVAGGERSFSKLSLVKSCIRSTMLQERLSALVMLSAERELAKTLDYNDIINSFAVQKPRKALLQ